MKRAFTLIELLVVISIISLLASVVLASLNSAREKGRLGADIYFATQVDHTAGDQAIGIWDFNEGAGTVAGDRSGYANDGTLTNGPTWSANTPSGRGYSISFDGVNDYVATNASAANLGAFTFAAWVYPTVPGVAMTIQQQPGGIDIGMIIRTDGNVEFQTQSLTQAYANCGPVLYNKWNYVVGTYDGSQKSIYVNGIQCSKLAATGSQSFTGMRYGASKVLADYFTGLIDQPRIFTKSLTASEIGRLYADALASHGLADNVK